MLNFTTIKTRLNLHIHFRWMIRWHFQSLLPIVVAEVRKKTLLTRRFATVFLFMPGPDVCVHVGNPRGEQATAFHHKQPPAISTLCFCSGVSRVTGLHCDRSVISESFGQASTETRPECRTQRRTALWEWKNRARERDVVGSKANGRGEASGYSVHSAQTPCRPNGGTPASLAGWIHQTRAGLLSCAADAPSYNTAFH